MKKDNLVYVSTGLLVILLMAAAFALRLADYNRKAPPPSVPVVSVRLVRPKTVDTKPAPPRIYDLNELKRGGKAPLNAAANIRIKPEEVREAKEWRDADPGFKKRTIDELDTMTADSKKALERNPNDILAKRILIASERRKKIETENFEGKFFGENIKIEDVDTSTSR